MAAGGKVSMRLTGTKEFKERAKKAADDCAFAAGVAFYAVGNNIVLDSMLDTPVDTGNMRGSHYVTHPQKDADGRVYVEIGVGGAAESYVIEQHENLAFNHKEGHAKFLENAINQSRQDVVPMVRAFVKQVLDSGAPPTLPPSTVPEVPTSGLLAKVEQAKVEPPKRARPPTKKPSVKKRAKAAAKKLGKQAGKAGRKLGKKASRQASKLARKAGKAGKRAAKKLGKRASKITKKVAKRFKSKRKRKR